VTNIVSVNKDLFTPSTVVQKDALHPLIRGDDVMVS
jgi:hypothetical protein